MERGREYRVEKEGREGKGKGIEGIIDKIKRIG